MLARTMVAAAVLLAFPSSAYAQASPHCNAGGVCKVAIDVAAGKPCTDQANITVKPDTVIMGPGGQRMIVWTLPGAYRFCPANGDGILFKSSELDFQFFDGARWHTSATATGRALNEGSTVCAMKSYRDVDDWFAYPDRAKDEIEGVLDRTGKQVAVQLLAESGYSGCALRGRENGEIVGGP